LIKLVEYFLLISLVGVGIQDFKERKIYWIFIPLIWLLCFFRSYTLFSLKETLQFVVINSVFFILQLVFLFIYFTLKNKKFTNILNQSLGAGDILFVLAISPAFQPITFISYYSISLLITLIVSVSLINKNINKHIPLAGFLALIFFSILVLNYFNPEISTYSDEYLIRILFHENK
jgi:hypothetical protein